MKKLVLIIAISFFSIYALGQETKDAANMESSISLGFKFNAGASEVRESFTANPFNFVPDNKLQFAYNFGILTHYKFDVNNGIGLEVFYNKVNGLDHLGEDYIDGNGEKFGSGYRDIERHLSYLSIPVYYTYSISKWRFGIGIQTSFALSATNVQTFNGTRNGMPYYYQVTNNDYKIKDYDVGPKLCIFYKLSDNLVLNADYYIGVTTVNDNLTGYSSQNLNNEVLSFGIVFMVK